MRFLLFRWHWLKLSSVSLSLLMGKNDHQFKNFHCRPWIYFAFLIDYSVLFEVFINFFNGEFNDIQWQFPYPPPPLGLSVLLSHFHLQNLHKRLLHFCCGLMWEDGRLFLSFFFFNTLQIYYPEILKLLYFLTEEN